MTPTELHVFDFDGALYNSPRPLIDRQSFWHSPKSLQGYGVPGEDPRWIIPTVMAAKRAIARPEVVAVLCTARPLRGSLQAILKRMLYGAGLTFDHYALKPAWPLRTTPTYKAGQVHHWLLKYPTVSYVAFWDDLPENLVAVGDVVRSHGLGYRPTLTPGLT